MMMVEGNKSIGDATDRQMVLFSLHRNLVVHLHFLSELLLSIAAAGLVESETAVE